MIRSYAAGEALAKVGEVGDGLTIILVGKVDVARATPDAQVAVLDDPPGMVQARRHRAFIFIHPTSAAVSIAGDLSGGYASHIDDQSLKSAMATKERFPASHVESVGRLGQDVRLA